MRTPRLALSIAFLVTGILVSACAVADEAPSAQQPESPVESESSDSGVGVKAKPGKEKPKDDQSVELAADPAPEFEVETFEGETFAIREELGTPVVLNFWESW